MPEPKICPDCLMPLNDVHDPCYETDEGRDLDNAIGQMHFESEVDAGLHDDDDDDYDAVEERRRNRCSHLRMSPKRSFGSKALG